MKQVHDSKLLMSKNAAQAISGSSNSSRSPTQHLGLGPAKEIPLLMNLVNELQKRSYIAISERNVSYKLPH